MNQKPFNGKAIYNPSGKAREYSYWACNFYVGCSNGCEYCYCKKGVLASTMGGNKPTLKKCFKNESHALEVFEKELKANLPELKKHGLFFSFTTDPLLSETERLTWSAVMMCNDNDIPVKVLTKNAEWVSGYVDFINNSNSGNEALEWRRLIAFGFTLTGHDELEQGASTNAERIEAMKRLYCAGFKTFASIEPVVDFDSSRRIIRETLGYCHLYKIGTMPGKTYSRKETIRFIANAGADFALFQLHCGFEAKLYFKDSILKHAKINREQLSDLVKPRFLVGRDYNMFENLTTVK